jgi:small subunit ribosomal protein S17
MAEDPDKETLETPEKPDEASGGSEGAGDSAAGASAPADTAAPADAEEKQASQAPAPGADDEQAAPAAPRRSEPVEELSPKERRRRTRSRHKGPAREQRSPQDRHAQRLVERRAKAVRRRARRLQERAKAVKRAQTGELPPVHAPVAGVRKVRQGVVVSSKAEKTITVRIDVARRHTRYEKIVRSSSTLHAHDENNDAHEGDIVRVVESRPLSRTKRWMLVDVLERAR